MSKSKLKAEYIFTSYASGSQKRGKGKESQKKKKVEIKGGVEKEKASI